MTNADPSVRLDRVVKAYDVRGLVPSELDTDLAHLIGRAAALELGAPELLVGRDMRTSSDDIAEALMRGARAEGCDSPRSWLRCDVRRSVSTLRWNRAMPPVRR